MDEQLYNPMPLISFSWEQWNGKGEGQLKNVNGHIDGVGSYNISSLGLIKTEKNVF